MLFPGLIWISSHLIWRYKIKIPTMRLICHIPSRLYDLTTKLGPIVVWPNSLAQLTHCGLITSYCIIELNIGSGYGLLPGGTKLLIQPMLFIHQWGLVAVTLGQFHQKRSRYLSWYKFEIYRFKITDVSLRCQSECRMIWRNLIFHFE